VSNHALLSQYRISAQSRRTMHDGGTVSIVAVAFLITQEISLNLPLRPWGPVALARLRSCFVVKSWFGTSFVETGFGIVRGRKGNEK
jgi:hypothetical protein